MAFIKDLSTIADSIRREKEITNKMTIHDMAIVLKPSLILVDWEGTILKYYDREEALALGDFPAPSTFSKYTEIDHEYLVFTEWNWTIQEAKSWLSVHKSTPLIVGAIYDTVDQKNHYEYIETEIDGETFFVATKVKLHTNIFNNESDPNGEYEEEYETFFNHHNVELLMYALRAISLSNNCVFPIYFYGNNGEETRPFYFLYSNINIPRTITAVPPEVFRNYGSLVPMKIISFPATFVEINAYDFFDCPLDYLSFPDSMESFSISAAGGRGCYLKILECPNNSLNMSGSIFHSGVKDAIIIPPLVTGVGTANVGDPLPLKAILIEGTPSINLSEELSNMFTELLRMLCPFLKFYVPRSNLSWFESATNWCVLYSDFFEAIEDNIEYLESLGVNVDDYKGSEE